MLNLIRKIPKEYYKILFYITAFIVFIFATTNDHMPLHFHNADKVKHMTAFFTLSFLLNRASSTLAHRFRNIIALLLFGILIEVVQYFIPARDSDYMDILADFAGIMLFQVAYSSFRMVRELFFKLKTTI